MLSRLKILLFVPLMILGSVATRAQDNDYLKHGKIFCLCSMKLECSYCRECDAERYTVKINNNLDKKITQVFYKFYSEPFNRILEKEADIEIRTIDGHETANLHVCVPEGKHWIISKIVYSDGSANTFTIKDRLSNFSQDLDECDCND